MALNTYAALQSSVAGWLIRTDLTARIPDFITLAEAQISRRLLKDGPVIDMMADDDITVNAEYLDVPARFLGVIAIYLGSSTEPLEYLQPEKVVQMKMLHPNESGKPRFYTVVGRRIRFWPWNGDSIAGVLTFWEGPEPLSDSVTTNWLLQLHPDAYLYGALVQAAPYMDEDDRTQTFAAFFSNIIADIVTAGRVTRQAPHMSAPRPQIPA